MSDCCGGETCGCNPQTPEEVKAYNEQIELKKQEFEEGAEERAKQREMWSEENSALVQHAKRELKAAGLFDEDSDYGGMLGDAVLDLIKVFAKQGHSGYSAHMTLELFGKLGSYKNLTPITDSPDDWSDVSGYNSPDRPKMWQCRRNPALFSEDGGKTYYSVDDAKRVKKESAKSK